jgi:hypothetical protein
MTGVSKLCVTNDAPGQSVPENVSGMAGKLAAVLRKRAKTSAKRIPASFML